MNQRDITVLVIEDDEDLRHSLTADLAEAGYRLLSASSGKLALEVLNFNQVDVVISDLKMPGMDAMETLREMRVLGHTQPFIVLSGFGTRDEMVELLRLGVFYFIEKPTTFEVLKAVVEEAALLRTIISAKVPHRLKQQQQP